MTAQPGVIALRAEDARVLTEQIKTNVEALWELIQRAYHGRAWTAVGYSSWSEYCAEEFGSSRLRLPRGERAEVVSILRESGLSIRAIAAATGADAKTVQRDLAGVGSSHTITGTDGKTYPASRARLQAEIAALAAQYPDDPATRDAMEFGLTLRYQDSLVTHAVIEGGMSVEEFAEKAGVPVAVVQDSLDEAMAGEPQ